MPMISKRAAVRAGKTLNKLSEHFGEKTVEGLRMSRLMTEREAEEAIEAVRISNEVIYQHYGIPKDVREYWHMEVGSDGVPMRDLAEE